MVFKNHFQSNLQLKVTYLKAGKYLILILGFSLFCIATWFFLIFNKSTVNLSKSKAKRKNTTQYKPSLTHYWFAYKAHHPHPSSSSSVQQMRVKHVQESVFDWCNVTTETRDPRPKQYGVRDDRIACVNSAVLTHFFNNLFYFWCNGERGGKSNVGPRAAIELVQKSNQMSKEKELRLPATHFMGFMLNMLNRRLKWV